MRKRKPVVVMTAGLLTLTTLMSGVMVAYADTTPAVSNDTITQAEARYPAGAYLTSDGERIEGFDPSQGGIPVSTGETNSAMFAGGGGVIELHDLPAGWHVLCDMRNYPETSDSSAFYTVTNGEYIYRWWVRGASGITHTVDELRSVRLTLNNTVLDGYDASQDVTIHNTTPSDLKGYENLPETWVCAQGEAEDGSGYELDVHPKNSDTPTVRYTFAYDSPDPSAGVESITAYLTDGSPVTDFNPTDDTKGRYIPYGYDVRLYNLPAGWRYEKTDYVTNPGKYALSVYNADGREVQNSPFMFFRIDNYQWTYVLAQLSGLSATYAFEDAHRTPVDGFIYTGSTFTVPAGVTSVQLAGYPSKWTQTVTRDDDGFTANIVSPDRTVNAAYRFLYGTETPSYSAADLSGVTATVDGEPVKGFDPTVTGSYDVAEDATVKISDIPDKWTLDHEKGTLVWTVSSPDKTVSVTYTFNPVIHQPALDDLKDVKALTQTGTEVAGFDPKNGGTFTVPADTTGIRLEGLPATGWTCTPMSGKLGYTLDSSDGKYHVTYLFQPESVKHTVTFDYAYDGRTEKETIEDGKTVGEKKPDKRDGYTFKGWTLDGAAYDFTQPVKADLTLVAQWEKDKPKTYTVTFDVNGGKETISPQTVETGMTANRPTDPTRDGHDFKGWQTADGKAYDFTTPVTKDLTLTAQWEKQTPPAPVTHTVTFDVNGGKETISPITVNDGATVTMPANPTRDGYAFTGWYQGDTKYDATKPVTADITLTARWEENKPASHTVTFDYAYDGKTSRIEVTDRQPVSEPSAPTRDGYTFTGWQTADGQPYVFSTPVTTDITLTAQWVKNEQPAPVLHTVTVDSADGTKPTVHQVEDGQTLAKPADPVRDGYTFTGWQVNGDPFDFTQPITGDVTITAGWEKNPAPTPVTHTVTINPNNGQEPTVVNVEDGQTLAEPDAPTRDGYDFKGWQSNGTAYDFTQPVTGNLTIEAMWEKKPEEKKEHVVSVNPNNGDMVSTVKVKDGDTLPTPDTPTRDGYVFDGWYAGDTQYDFTQPVTGAFTITAHWRKQAVTYTVSFDTNGGSTVPEQTVNEGEKAHEPSIPVRAGYTFNGWLLDGQPYDFDTPVVTNLTLTADWEKNTPPATVEHTVTVDPGNGDEPATYKVEDGKPFTQPDTPTRDGYEFTGWQVDGKDYDFTQPVTADLTLTGTWSKKETPTPAIHTVTFDTDGGEPAITAQTITHGKLAGMPVSPSKTGYRFAGWYHGDARFDFLTPVTEDITLTAHWEQKETPKPDERTVTVTFDKGDGSDPVQVTVTKGETVARPDTPVRDGYEFTGWMFNGEPFDFTVPVTNDLILTGSWKQADTPKEDEDKPAKPSDKTDDTKPDTPSSDDKQTGIRDGLAKTGANLIGLIAFSGAVLIAGLGLLLTRRTR